MRPIQFPFPRQPQKWPYLKPFWSHACLYGLLSLAASGCHSDSSDEPIAPPASNAPAVPQSWSLKLESHCPESVGTGNCVAEYGFTVQTDGHFLVGPGPKNELRQGTLTPDEHNQLNQTLTPLLVSAQGPQPERHQAIDAGNSDDTLTLILGAPQSAPPASASGNRGADTPTSATRAAATEGSASAPGVAGVLLVRTQGTNLYAATGASLEDAKAVHGLLKTLAQKYYALPFPEGCSDGAALLQNRYPTLQMCERDSDCSYFDAAFNPLSADSLEYVITDDCSLITPLAVGNLQRVTEVQAALIEALNEIRTACGERYQRAGCTQPTGFQPNHRAPSCQAGVCQLNPPTGS
jgi:hypothetical protein